MTIETFLWIFATALPFSIGWGILMHSSLCAIRRDTSELLKMHKEPDEYGFGTGAQTKVIEDNTKAFQALTHYLIWFMKETTGKVPPPHLDGMN